MSSDTDMNRIMQHMSIPMGQALACVIKASKQTRGGAAIEYLREAERKITRPEACCTTAYQAYTAVSSVADKMHPAYRTAVWTIFNADSLHTDTAANTARDKVLYLIELAKKGIYHG